MASGVEDRTMPVMAAPASDSLAEQAALRGVLGRMFGEGGPPRASAGRYVLERRLGEGGMGVVYLASDPKLGRTVAIKAIRGDGAYDTPDGHARLEREARALARIKHRNVVAIYDVVTTDNALFIVMEHIDGGTLADWMKQGQPRSLDAVLDVFTQAGEGLAAAHAAGLVHRDFKPANVMLTRQGRAIVTDFGLARDVGTPDETLGSHSSIDKADELTRPGAVVGTPAYMALEQLRGRPAGPQSDQFAFCVALWRALFGERPFTSTHVVALIREIAKGPPKPPARRACPRWLAKILRRGLAPEPANRFASMADVVDALRRRGGWRPFIAPAVGTVAAAAVAAALLRPGADRPGCDDEPGSLAGVWDDGQRVRQRDAAGASGAHAASAKFEVYASRMDAAAAQWLDARAQACAPAETPAAESRARVACLGFTRDVFEATAASLADGSRAGAMAAFTRARTGVGPTHACLDADATARSRPLPVDAAQRAALARVELCVAKGRALAELTSHLDTAVAQLQECQRIASDVGHDRAWVSVAMLQAEIDVLHTSVAVARSALADARDRALAIDDLPQAHAALVGLIRADSTPGRLPQVREHYAAAAAIEQQVELAPRVVATARAALGDALARARVWDEAAPLLGEAGATLRAADDPMWIGTARSTSNALVLQGQPDAARRTLDDAVAYALEHLEPTSRLRLALSASAASLDGLIGTAPALRRSLALRTELAAAYAEAGLTLNLGIARYSRALLLLKLGDIDGAEASVETAVPMFETTGAGAFRAYAQLLRTEIATEREDFPAAVARAREAMDLAAEDPGTNLGGMARLVLGNALLRSGKMPEARTEIEIALTHMPPHFAVAISTAKRLLAEIALTDGDPTKGEALALDALAALPTIKGTEEDMHRAKAHLVYARAAQARAPAVATAHATLASAIALRFVGTADGDTYVQEIREWLTARAR